MPESFLPKQITAFYTLWCENNLKNLSSITFQLSSDPKSEVKVLDTILKAFGIPDTEEDSLESISLTVLQELFEEMTIPSKKAMENVYQLKVFPHIKLKPASRLLFDVAHRVFFSQIGTCDQVPAAKFRMMVIVY